MANPLRNLQEYGQSVWLDFVSRELLTSGQLGRLIGDDGLRGVTSGPSAAQCMLTSLRTPNSPGR